MDLHFGQCTTAVPSGSVKSSRSAHSFEKCPQLVHSINSSSCNISHLMFAITYHLYLWIPTGPAVSTFAALLRGWTGCILQDYHRGIRPAVVTLPNHRRRESDNEILWLLRQVIFYPRFTRRHPVVCIRR